MKASKYYIFLSAALLALSLTACRKETLSPDSVIVGNETVKNEFDSWLEMNYLIPYNIQVKYRYDIRETGYSSYTVPAEYDNSVVLAHLVKYLCIDVYDEVAGIRFTQSYFPKMFVYYGEWVYNSGGSYTRGSAEGGKKIILYGVNHVDECVTNVDNLRTTFIPTIHHEFMHILNQVKDFPTEFSQITPGDYVTSSWNKAPYNSPSYFRPHGFISTYSQMSDREDMAEMLSQFVMYPQEWWDDRMEESVEYEKDDSGAFILDENGEKKIVLDGRPAIQAKLDIMRTYLKDSFNVDLDMLRASIQRRLAEIAGGKVDLESLSID